LQNQQTLTGSPSFLKKQTIGMFLVLGKLAENTQRNYPRVYGVDLGHLTSDMIHQVMDYLLLQCQIVGWHSRGNSVDVTADPTDLERLPPNNGRWRTRSEARREQESLERRPIQIFSKHFETLGHSTLNQEELIALTLIINNLSRRDHTFTSLTGRETAGL